MKRRTNQWLTIVAPVVVILLYGCATISAPVSKSDTLLVIPVTLDRSAAGTWSGQPSGEFVLNIKGLSDPSFHSQVRLDPNSTHAFAQGLPPGDYLIDTVDWVDLQGPAQPAGQVNMSFELSAGRITVPDLVTVYQVHATGNATSFSIVWDHLTADSARKLIASLKSDGTLASWQLSDATNAIPAVQAALGEGGQASSSQAVQTVQRSSPVASSGDVASAYQSRPPEALAKSVPDQVRGQLAGGSDQGIAALAHYLTSGTDDPFLQVKALHDWVALNITYDFASFSAGSIPPQEPSAVIQSGLAVCDGYSRLFSALATAAGIQNQVVTGYSRGYGSSILNDDAPGSPNHAWNAVQIKGTWYLLDCTWDSGYIQDGKAVREYSTQFLFLAPEEMIYSHYPQEANWQLLAKPLGPSDFTALPYYRGNYFELGLKAASDVVRLNPAGETASLKIPTPSGVTLNATMISADGQEQQNRTFIQREGGITEIRAAFPAAGSWIVRVFAAPNGQDQYAWVCDVGYLSTSGTPTGFPVQYEKYFDDNCTLSSPLGSPLITGEQTNLQVQLPGYTSAFLGAGTKQLQLISHGGSQFSLSFTVPPCDQLTLFAEKSGQSDYTGIVAYRVVASAP